MHLNTVFTNQTGAPSHCTLTTTIMFCLCHSCTKLTVFVIIHVIFYVSGMFNLTVSTKLLNENDIFNAKIAVVIIIFIRDLY